MYRDFIFNNKSLMLIPGALGVIKKSAVFEVGGYKVGHLGEGLEMVMRLHRYNREVAFLLISASCCLVG